MLPSFLFAKKTSPITKRRACAMNKENKQIKLDRSQGTQWPSKENAVNLYSVKEVCDITGLTRKQLFDYQKLIQPTSHDKSGYKLYDNDAVQKLALIAELRNIETPLSEIRKLLAGETGKMSVIYSQIKVLEERKKQVNDMIAKAQEQEMLNINWYCSVWGL